MTSSHNPGFVTLLLALAVTACAENPVSPPDEHPIPATASANGAVLTSAQFDVYNDYDIVLSCMNGESTHWEGTVHVTIDATVTPAGRTQEQVSVVFDDDYFVERENGVRYYPVGPFPVTEHHLFEPVTVIAGTAAGAWKSADGDVLVLGFHAQFVYDSNGEPVLEKFTGACP